MGLQSSLSAIVTACIILGAGLVNLVSFRNFLWLLSFVYFLYLQELPSFLQEGMG